MERRTSTKYVEPKACLVEVPALFGLEFQADRGAGDPFFGDQLTKDPAGTPVCTLLQFGL